MKPHTVSDTARHTGKGPSSPRITTHRPASHTVTNQETRSHTRPPTVTPRGGSHPHTATCRWVSHAHPHCGHPQISITSVHKHLQTGRTRTVTPARRREGHTHTHTQSPQTGSHSLMHSHPQTGVTPSHTVTPGRGSHTRHPGRVSRPYTVAAVTPDRGHTAQSPPDRDDTRTHGLPDRNPRLAAPAGS